MDEIAKLNPDEHEFGVPSARNKWSRKVRVVVLLVAFIVVCLLVVKTTQRGRFYLTFPSMSWAEFSDIAHKAQNADAESQLYYGVFHANGDGVQQDYGKAAEWYRKAAVQGNAAAQRNLGVLYDYGLGVEQDYKKAAHWYLKAAYQLDAAAHIGVAGILFTNMPSAFPKHFVWPERGWVFDGNFSLSNDYSSDPAPFGGHDQWLFRALLLTGVMN